MKFLRPNFRMMLEPYEFPRRSSLIKPEKRQGPSPLSKYLYALSTGKGADLFYDESKFTTLSKIFRQKLVESLVAWTGKDSVNFRDEMKLTICRAVCEWIGIPLRGKEGQLRIADLVLTLEGQRSAIKYPRSLLANRRTQSWVRGLIEDVRSGRLHAQVGSVLEAVAYYEDSDGELLDPEIAAEEFLNFMRPALAISEDCVSALQSLETGPGIDRRRLLVDDSYLRDFVKADHADGLGPIYKWALVSETVRFLLEDISYQVSGKYCLERVHFKSQLQRAQL